MGCDPKHPMEPNQVPWKWYEDTLTDKNSISISEQSVEEWLKKLDKSGLSGKYKCWIYQHGLLPRLIRPITVYQVPYVEEVEMTGNTPWFLHLLCST